MTLAKTPIYFDTDLGIDDSMALAYLLATPEIEIKGIGTVGGNCSAAQAARNTLDLLGIAGRADIPVAVGCHDWLAHPFDGGSPEVHGANGIGDIELPTAAAEPVDEHAVDMLIRLAHEHPGQLRVLAVGPFTNLAAAVQKDPAISELVDRVVVMGGAAMVPGNMTPVAEANVNHDPEAAAVVLAAPWQVTTLGLDVTMDHQFEEADRIALVDSGRPVAGAIAAMMDGYADFYTGVFGRRAVALHDPLAAAAACGHLTYASAPVVDVVVDDTDGPGRGQTIADLRGRFRGFPEQPGAHAQVVLELERPFAPMLLERIVSL
ncbi:ribonucleoside hydrolase [Microlunatus phosphovorus NM-1]|uniref:Ribonucleoside hydrolase n=1 Tax=Microlunatus phosphovorus (strain ATCC 700054 / DSM 10555 / JCM 9379 / NBRC 101784 / NCIMB 13414 / VKM Ac-1990 / NM-1) TaxID=1032480 RepID=F5XQ68_MICPN|nr:ribonucleoside hydrolase [Microlunatus phosphovorus NM-1]